MKKTSLWIPCFSTLCALLGLAAHPSLSQAQEGDYRQALGDADPAWVDSWEYEIDKQVDLLVSAYGLDADNEAALRTELGARLVQQHEYDAKMQAELTALAAKITEGGVDPSNEDAPEVKALNDRFIALTNGMPLNELQTAAWIESRVPASTAQEGRQRLGELLERRFSDQSTARGDLESMSGKKATLTQESMNMTAGESPTHSRPLPPGDLGELVAAQDRVDRLKRYSEPGRPQRKSEQQDIAAADVPVISAPPVVTEPPRVVPQPPVQTPPATPSSPAPPRPVVLPPQSPAAAPPKAQAPQAPPPPLAPAPPLDEWEKHMLATADKYTFDHAQTTNARSVLSDLRRRAYQYQVSRAEDYARAELMTDPKARTEQLRTLNKPLDALFEELKQRLESLPTQSQKQKAGQPAPKK